MITHVVFRAWGGRRASVPGLRRVATDLNTSATAINLARLTILGLRSQPGGWSAEGTRSPASQPDELASVSDELAQLPELRRRDVGLGETSEAQQVDEVLGVSQVVLHPPVTPVVAERVSEVHVCTELPEIIGEPVVRVGPERGCRPFGWSSPRSALPNRTCEFPRIRLSTSSCRWLCGVLIGQPCPRRGDPCSPVAIPRNWHRRRVEQGDFAVRRPPPRQVVATEPPP